MEELQDPVLIHPGFHKTGTTFLQREVFTDPRLFRLLWCHDEAHQFVIGAHELDFDAQPGRRDLEARRTPSSKGVIDVVSSETLSGTPFFGARESAGRAFRLKSIFDDARILITVRRQQPMLRATYLQYLRQGGTLAPEAFFDQRPPHDYYGFDGGIFEFHKLAELYAELFGEDRVLVLTQETLQRDPDGFVQTLRSFCAGGDEVERVPLGEKRRENVSPKASGIPLLRLASRLVGGPVNPEMRTPFSLVGWGLRKGAYRQDWLFRNQGERLDQAISQRFKGRYAESNARLQKFSSCDLRALKYELPSADEQRQDSKTRAKAEPAPIA